MESITDFIGGGYKEMLGKAFRFKTVEDAETYFWEKMARDIHDDRACDAWVESIGDDIEEVWLENK